MTEVALCVVRRREGWAAASETQASKRPANAKSASWVAFHLFVWSTLERAAAAAPLVATTWEAPGSHRRPQPQRINPSR